MMVIDIIFEVVCIGVYWRLYIHCIKSLNGLIATD